MLRAVSTYIFVKERLHPGLLDKLATGGAQAIEIFGARQHLDYANRKQHVREVAEHVPFRFLIQHIGVPNESFNERKFESAMTSVEHLRAFAKPLGVRILVENIPNELSTPDRLIEFIRTSHMDDVGVCFDTGH